MVLAMVIVCILGIFVLLVVVFLGCSAIFLQNSAISSCFKVRELHDKVITGKLSVRDLTDRELLLLRRPMFTHVGFGGVGPFYNPSFDVFRLVGEELFRRREGK